MSTPGIGVMIEQLSGYGDTAKVLTKAIGKTIKEAVVADDVLKLFFEDGTAIGLYDGGQSCCEHRYMNTDDDLTHFVGSTLTGFRIEDGPEIDGEAYNPPESQFLLTDTSKGTFTVVNYNSHNGYYGGFAIRARDENA
jgi:hypothetical protein